MQLEQIDARLGLNDLSGAEALLDSLAERAVADDWLARRLDLRRVELLERRHGFGLGACEANVDEQPRPLARVDDPLAAWNELRTGLPADHAIPIPSDEEQARELLCPSGCAPGQPSFARLEGDNEATVALVLAHEDGGFSVLPDLLHPRATSCTDETTLAFERQGELLRVRAFADRRELVSVDDWSLVELPSYGAPPPVNASSSSYAYAPSYTYAHGYGYGYYGCSGGYDYEYEYEYETCEPSAHVERDLVIDLEHGELVLDLVRTGPRGSALGRVTMAAAPEGATVELHACGERRTLALSHAG